MIPQPSITTLEFGIISDNGVNFGQATLQKHLKRLINMARPDGFEPPTTWFEARYPTVVVFPLSATFIAH